MRNAHFVGLATLAICAATGAALAEIRPSLTSVYSEISRTRCPNDFNRPLSQLGEQPITYSCPGRAGFAVDVTYRGASVQVTFRRSGEKQAHAQLGAGHDVGDVVEWRGEKGVKGFAPGAAILRLRTRDNSGKPGDVFGIVRLAEGKACPAAFIDAAANPNASELARRTADEIAAEFPCGEGAPRIVGVETTRAAEALARSR